MHYPPLARFLVSYMLLLATHRTLIPDIHSHPGHFRKLAHPAHMDFNIVLAHMRLRIMLSLTPANTNMVHLRPRRHHTEPQALQAHTRLDFIASLMLNTLATPERQEDTQDLFLLLTQVVTMHSQALPRIHMNHRILGLHIQRLCLMLFPMEAQAMDLCRGPTITNVRRDLPRAVRPVANIILFSQDRMLQTRPAQWPACTRSSLITWPL
jgi:hypothetical protein